MSSFGFFRTIWITLRATNYTTRAFKDTIRGIKEMEAAQIEFRLSAQRNIMGVGTMYLAFGGIAIGVISKLITASKEGEMVMDRFGKSVGKSLAKLSKTMIVLVGPILDVVAAIFEFISANSVLRGIVALLLTLGTAYFFIVGAVKLLTGAITTLMIKKVANLILTKAMSGAYAQYILDTGLAAYMTNILGISIASVVGGLSMGIALVTLAASVFGKWAGVLTGVILVVIGLAIAIAALRASMGDWTGIAQFGAALAIGGGLGAAFIAGQPEYQMGTSFVRKGGIAVLHEGEEVKSAREGKREAHMDRGQSYTKTSNTVVLNLYGNLETKTDKETLMPAIRREIKEVLDEKV